MVKMDMKDSETFPTNNNVSNNIELFNCAGNGCGNYARNRLTILYLHKSGWFCDSCKRDLLDSKLVEET